MGELTIKLDDARLIEALQEMAAVHRQPLEAEVQKALERAVEDHKRRMELVQKSRDLRAMTPRGVQQTDSVELIREMREERDRALGG